MISWVCFEWKIAKLPLLDRPVAPLVLRAAEKSDEDGVVMAILSAFSMDSTWGGGSLALKEHMAESVESAFKCPVPGCVVLLHGTRIVGASVVDVGADAENHLPTGPCILHEYWNRGLGTALLHDSLAFLHEQGVSKVRGVTRSNSIAARFVYPKFGGVLIPYVGIPVPGEAA